DFYETDEDEPLIVPADGVLANDADTEGDELFAALVSDTGHGVLVLNPDGSFEYSPSLDFEGVDSFTYNATDGTSTSVPATVSITVGGENDAPVAFDDTYATDEDEPLNVAAQGVLMNDTDTENDPLTSLLVDGPSNGEVIMGSDGNFTYTPEADFNGVDSFTYKANDESADSNVATVTITVNPVNDAPVAVIDSYVTDDDIPLVVSGLGVLANDTDAELDSLTTIDVSESLSFSLNANGSFVFTPEDGVFDEVVFIYKAFDGIAESIEVEVRIKVEEQDPLAG
ncbi:MAG TPA: cadherin-like domain-containing protein, partial [Nitrososphaera sp.]|nr:cadherin-like domain-containing protein [Nitrososphaera sp.]